jgi:hypothetical protein
MLGHLSQKRPKQSNLDKTVKFGQNSQISQKKSKLSKSAKSAMGFGFSGFVIVDLN